MDAARFDTLARSLTRSSSRRTALRLLATSAVGGLLGGLLDQRTAAHDLSKTCKKKSGKAKKKCLKKAKAHNTAHAARPPVSPPPPFCASQPNGSPCGFCRRCRDGACVADLIQNDASCGSDGTGKCLNGVCNTKPTCSPHNGSCTTVADCCSNGSTQDPTTCPADGLNAHQCVGRSDPGQPCHESGHCSPQSFGCLGYVCQ